MPYIKKPRSGPSDGEQILSAFSQLAGAVGNIAGSVRQEKKDKLDAGLKAEQIQLQRDKAAMDKTEFAAKQQDRKSKFDKEQGEQEASAQFGKRMAGVIQAYPGFNEAQKNAFTAAFQTGDKDAQKVATQSVFRAINDSVAQSMKGDKKDSPIAKVQAEIAYYDSAFVLRTRKGDKQGAAEAAAEKEHKVKLLRELQGKEAPSAGPLSEQTGELFHMIRMGEPLTDNDLAAWRWLDAKGYTGPFLAATWSAGEGLEVSQGMVKARGEWEAKAQERNKLWTEQQKQLEKQDKSIRQGAGGTESILPPSVQDGLSRAQDLLDSLKPKVQ